MPGAPEQTSLWRGDHQPLTLGIVALVTLFAFEGMATATAMPVVARELDAMGGYTWAFNAFIVASLFSMVAGGLWADAAGPRDPMIASVVTFALGAAVAGLATGLPMLVVGRAVQGLGGGALIVALYVLIARAYSVDLRPRAFSVLSAAWIVPSLVGPFVAGWLADNVSWRAVFLLVPVFVIPPAILLFPRIKGLHGGTPHPKGGRRLIAAIVAMAGLFAVQDGVLRLNLAGVAEAVVGVAVLVFSLRFLLPQGALRMTRGLPASVMMRGFLSGAFFSAEVFIPLALVETRGVSTAQAGLALAASAVFWASGSYVQSRLPGEQDRSNAVRAGAAIITVALLTLPLAVLTTLPPGITAISWAIGAFGMGLSVPSVAVQVMRLSPEEDQGVNGAAIQVFDSVMIALTTSVLGLGLAIAVAGGGATAMTYVDLWLASAVMGLVAVALAGRMRPTRV